MNIDSNHVPSPIIDNNLNIFNNVNRVINNSFDREEEIQILALAWHQVKRELNLFKRMLRVMKCQSNKTKQYQKILSKINQSATHKLLPIGYQITDKENRKTIEKFLKSFLSKGDGEIAPHLISSDDVSTYISQLENIIIMEEYPIDVDAITDEVFDAAVIKLKTEQDGDLVGPKLQPSKKFLGYPLFTVQNFISDAIQGKVLWPNLKFANSRILRPLWRAIAKKVGISENGLFPRDLFSLHLQGMKILKHRFKHLEELFYPPYETSDLILNKILNDINITPDKMENFHLGIHAPGNDQEMFCDNLKKALTKYFQAITGELIHPEGDNFESLHMFIKSMQNHIMMLEECAKVTMDDDPLFERYSECLIGNLCFNAKDRAVQDFHQAFIVPKIIENFAEMTSEAVLKQQIDLYFEKQYKLKQMENIPTPLSFKGMIKAGDLTYTIPFENIQTCDSASINLEDLLNTVIEEYIAQGKIATPENDDWKQEIKNPLHEYINNLLNTVQVSSHIDLAPIRKMLMDYSMMNKKDILNDISEKVLKDESGGVRESGVIEFKTLLSNGNHTFGIPLQDICAVGMEPITMDDINQFIEDLVNLFMLEDDRN